MSAHILSLHDTRRDIILRLGTHPTHNVSQFKREYNSNASMNMDDRLVERIDAQVHVDASNPRYKHIYITDWIP